MVAPAKTGGGSAGLRRTSAFGNPLERFPHSHRHDGYGDNYPQNQHVMEYAF
jgi:hypothetical protein